MTGACPPEQMQSPGQKKRTRAVKREAVLGRAASPQQLEELAELMPMCEVTVEHYRHVENISERRRLLTGKERGDVARRLQKRLVLWPKGGSTTVTIRMGDRTFRETATCSLEDNFNRRLGVRIAFGRALKKAKSPAVSAVEDLATALYGSVGGKTARKAA